MYPTHTDGDFMVQLDTNMLTVTFPHPLPPALNSGSVCIIYRSLELIQHNSTPRLRSPFLLIGTINTSRPKTSVLLLRLKLRVTLKNLSQGLILILLLLKYRKVLQVQSH